MRRISEDPPEEAASEEWALSYGDTITLIFTFFVMLAPLMSFEKETPELALRLQQTYDQINGYAEQHALKDKMDISVDFTKGIHIVASSDAISFLPGQWTLHKESYPILKAIGESVKGQPYTVRVVGHTDSTAMKPIGIVKTNLSLSMRRAVSVINYLVRQAGVSSGVFTAQGFGEYQPRASNATPEGRAANRRVEIWVVPNLQAFRALEAAQKAAAPADTTQAAKAAGA